MRAEAIDIILGAIPEVAGSYFAMILSGDTASIITGIIVIFGLAIFLIRIVKRFWYHLVD